MPALETLTFVFTDIQGSTARWEAEPDAMRDALATHDALLEEAFGDGDLFKHTGDGVCAAFGSVTAAIEAAVAAQRSFNAQNWPTSEPVLIRIGINTGEAQRRGDDYFGTTLNRAARIMDIGHGGQVLVSTAARSLATSMPGGVDVRDLGEHRLRDLGEAEHVYQLVADGLVEDFPPLRSVEAYSTNLPSHLSAFIGREEEVAEVIGLLAESRLVTLTGVGGVGKTRLAIQVGAESLDRFEDGVWIVELAPISEPALVVREVADALGVPEEAGRPQLDVLLDHVRDRSLLIVLDNCEHLIDEAAKFAEQMLRASPGLRMIATSREGLAIGGERLWRVPSMTRSGATGDAVALFVERARHVDPSFQLTSDNEEAVEEICTRLDGIPLAIELATARLKVFPPEQIAERLGDRFRLLTGGSRTALPRQRTLQATMDWSYDLLTEHQRTLLRRLSVFYGGFEFASAEEVCGVDPIGSFEVLDLLTQLIESSLVVVDDSGESRYALLETVRQYGLDRLVESGEADDARRRHADYFAELAETVDDGLLGDNADVFMKRLQRDHDNVRAALTWAIEAGESSTVLRLAEGMGRFWFFGSFIREGGEWFDRALRAVPAEESQAYSELRSWAGTFAIHRGDFIEAEGHLDEALAIVERLGETTAVARAMNGRGNLDLARGHLSSALSHYEAALDTASKAYRGVVLVNLGMTLAWMGHVDRANACAEELDSSFADNWAWSLVVRSYIEEISGTLESTSSVLRDTYERLRTAGERVLEAWVMIGLADVDRRAGDLDAALDWSERASRLGREIGSGSTDWVGRVVSGRIRVARGEIDEARGDLGYLIRHGVEHGSIRNLALASELGSRLAVELDRPEDAVRLIGASDRLLSEGSEVRPHHLRTELDEMIDGLDIDSPALLIEGAGLDQEALVELLRSI